MLGVIAAAFVACTCAARTKIIGLFPLTGRDGNIGESRASGALHALNWLRNDPERLAEGFPNNYTLQIVDTANSKETTLNRVYNHLLDPDVAGIIGASSSGVSAAVSTLSSAMSVVQISYASTQTDLSDKSAYPLFCRVVPPNIQQIRALLGVLTHFGWHRVSVVTTSDGYGTSLSNDFQREVSLEEWRDISVDAVSSIPIVTGEDNSQLILETLRRIRAAPARVVFLAATEVNAREIMTQAAQLGMAGDDSGWVWIASDGWSQTSIVDDYSNLDLVKAATGVLGVAPVKPPNSTFYQHFADSYEQNRTRLESFLNDTSGCFAESPVSCQNFLQGDINLYSYFAFDSTYTLIRAIDAMHRDSTDISTLSASEFSKQLVAEIKNLSLSQNLQSTQLQPVTGDLVFDDNCDRDLPFDVINSQYNAQTNEIEVVAVARWSSSHSRSLQRLPADDTPVPNDYREDPNGELRNFVFADGTESVPKGYLQQPCTVDSITYDLHNDVCGTSSSDGTFDVSFRFVDGVTCDTEAPGAVQLPATRSVPCDSVHRQSSAGIAVQSVAGVVATMAVVCCVALLVSQQVPTWVLRNRKRSDLTQQQQLILSAAHSPRLRRHAYRTAIFAFGMGTLVLAPVVITLNEREVWQCRVSAPLYTLALSLCLAPLLLAAKTLDDNVRLPAELGALVLATKEQRRKRYITVGIVVTVLAVLTFIGAVAASWEVAEGDLVLSSNVSTRDIDADTRQEFARVFGESFLSFAQSVDVFVPRHHCSVSTAHAWLFLALPAVSVGVALLWIAYIALRCMLYKYHNKGQNNGSHSASHNDNSNWRTTLSMPTRLTIFILLTLIAVTTVLIYSMSRHTDAQAPGAVARAEAPVHLAEVGVCIAVALFALLLLVLPFTWRTCANAKDVYYALYAKHPVDSKALERIDSRNMQMSVSNTHMLSTAYTASLGNVNATESLVDETKRRTLAELSTVLRDPVGFHFFLQFAASRYENETPQFWRQAKVLMKQLEDAAAASPNMGSERQAVHVMVDGAQVEKLPQNAPLRSAMSFHILTSLDQLVNRFLADNAPDQLNVSASLR
ncbi:MAG: hypothetical protein MHM6MM_003363, partial [Cercozoa sp. M6MM]